MNRSWDIEFVEGWDAVNEKLSRGPQLCQVLSKDINPKTFYNIAKSFPCFQVSLAGEDRSVVLCGAYVGEGEFGASTEKGVLNQFGRPSSDYISIELFDDLLHVDGVPYMPFCEDVDNDVLDLMNNVYDVQSVGGRWCVLCTYYENDNPGEVDGGVISQFEIETCATH